MIDFSKKDGHNYTLNDCWVQGTSHRAYGWHPKACPWHWTREQRDAYADGYAHPGKPDALLLRITRENERN